MALKQDTSHLCMHLKILLKASFHLSFYEQKLSCTHNLYFLELKTVKHLVIFTLVVLSHYNSIFVSYVY